MRIQKVSQKSESKPKTRKVRRKTRKFRRKNWESETKNSENKLENLERKQKNLEIIAEKLVKTLKANMNLGKKS